MTIVIVAIAAYLLVGASLCIKGKLATKIAYAGAIAATSNKLRPRKVWLYRMLLRLGVMVGWPVFWLGS